mgnify:CR=1 FL=1
MKALKKGILIVLFTLLYVLFLLILWIRPAVKMMLDLLSGLMFVGAAIYGGLGAFSGNVHWAIVTPLLIMSFVFFALSWLVDSIVLAVSPENIWLFD